MTASPLLTLSFIAFAFAISFGWAAFTGRWLWAAGWLLVTGALGASGVFDHFELPPRMLLFFGPTLVGVTIWGWRSDLWELPLSFLVGFQAFRIGVELLIHQAVIEGIAPPQMTWTGMNLDIVTGITALFLIPVASRMPKMAVHAWNLLGWGLLIKVIGVAILSMPTPLQRYTPDNTWVAFFPWIWLPTVHVAIAWMGHVVVLKKLTRSGGAGAPN